MVVAILAWASVVHTWKTVIILCGVATVCVIGYVVRSRLVAILGIFGICATQIVPEPPRYEDYSHFSERAVMARIQRSKEHAQFWTAIGGGTGVLIGLVVIAVQDANARRRVRVPAEEAKRDAAR